MKPTRIFTGLLFSAALLCGLAPYGAYTLRTALHEKYLDGTPS